MNRYARLMLIAGLMMILPPLGETKEKKIQVVATVSSLGEIAKQVGGEYVDVHIIVPPRLNPHFIQPKPSDVLKTKRADLFVYTGLHLELWLGSFVNAVGRQEVMPGGSRALDMSAGIHVLDANREVTTRAEGEMYFEGNPHYWLNPNNAPILAKTMAEKLTELAPEHQQDFERNRQAFVERLQQKIAQWQAQVAPFRGKELIAYHNEWPYFSEFTGLVTKHFLEPKPGIPPSPRQLQFIESYIQEQRIPAIIKAGHEPKEAAQQVAQRTGVSLIVLCHTVGELPECVDYFTIFDYNIAALIAPLKPEGAQP